MKQFIEETLEDVGKYFCIPGDYVQGTPYGSGHINDSFAVTYNQGGTDIRYIFQRINDDIFNAPEKLMANIDKVIQQQRKALRDRPDTSRRCLTLIPAVDGKPFCRVPSGDYWRAYVFIENATTYDVVENPCLAYQAAQAFGEFQRTLRALPGDHLSETIPSFHDTGQRYRHFERALEENTKDRARNVVDEIDFVRRRKDITGILTKLNAEGCIPTCVTHNDTKLNNVLIDNDSGEGICIIDLDTVMPGLTLYDFGDMVRSGTNSAAEDEKDLEKVEMRRDIFKALAEGYVGATNDFLTETELKYLPFSGKLITFETGLRFLTDYLNGDVYFKTNQEEHNLYRCRTQFKMVQSMEKQYDQMIDIVEKIREKIGETQCHQISE